MERLIRLDQPLKKYEIGSIVLSPTRELAHQIATVLETFTSFMNESAEEGRKLSVWRLIGGTEEMEDLKFLRAHGAQIIVATPGRLEQTMKKVPDLRFQRLEVLILDEADRLLDMGFNSSITAILNRLPKQRRTGLFSATMTKRVGELVKAGMRNPIKISIKVDSQGSGPSGTQVTPLSLCNYYALVETDAKFSFLVQFLKKSCQDKKVMIYFATIASVKFFRKLLTHFQVVPNDVPILGTHSDVPQNKREQIRQEFGSTRSAILLSTDVTARGVDFPDVDWVVQFDAPKEPDDFIHRSGRTARNGRAGNALLFLLPSEESYVDLMESRAVPLREFPETADLEVITLHPSSGATDAPSSSTTTDASSAPVPLVLARRTSASASRPAHTHAYLEGMVDYTPKLRELSLRDREFMDSGLYAFISFVASYKEHRANFSFRISQLDFGALARLFGLLKLPRMEEFSASKVTNFESVDIDLESIPYADKKREKQRLEKVAREKSRSEARSAAKKNTSKFSTDDFGKTSEDEAQEETDSDEASSESSSDDDFASEATLLRKLKQKKISEADYERLTGNDDLEEEIAHKMKNKINSKKRGPTKTLQPNKSPKHAKR